MRETEDWLLTLWPVSLMNSLSDGGRGDSNSRGETPPDLAIRRNGQAMRLPQ